MAILPKQSHGFSRPFPGFLGLGAGTASLSLLTLAMRTLHAGTACAAWTGLGAAGTVAVGAVALGEPVGALRMAGIALVLAGIIALRLET